jgi:hypothetical protein
MSVGQGPIRPSCQRPGYCCVTLTETMLLVTPDISVATAYTVYSPGVRVPAGKSMIQFEALDGPVSLFILSDLPLGNGRTDGLP